MRKDFPGHDLRNKDIPINWYSVIFIIVIFIGLAYWGISHG